MDYWDDCHGCSGQMFVHEAPGEDGTVVTEECRACGWIDAYVVDTEDTDAHEAHD